MPLNIFFPEKQNQTQNQNKTARNTATTTTTKTKTNKNQNLYRIKLWFHLSVEVQDFPASRCLCERGNHFSFSLPC